MASTWSFFPDAGTIIKAALRRFRGYDPEETTTITATQYANALETMNFLMSAWQAFGLQVWCIKETSKALTVSDGTYTIGSGGDISVNLPQEIVSARLRDSTNSTYPIDTPIDLINRETWYNIPSKSATGKPNMLYFDQSMTGPNSGATQIGTIQLWPLPDADTAAHCTLYLLYQRPLLDFNATTDLIDMPQYWFNALRLQLALAISPEYGIQAQDYQPLKTEADAALDLAKGFDGEHDSMTIVPEQE